MRFNRGVGEQVMEAFQKMMEQSEADSDASPPPAKKTKKLPSEVMDGLHGLHVVPWSRYNRNCVWLARIMTALSCACGLRSRFAEY